MAIYVFALSELVLYKKAKHGHEASLNLAYFELSSLRLYNSSRSIVGWALPFNVLLSSSDIESNKVRILGIFPGQGSQYPMMGSDLYEHYACARLIYEQASNAVDFDLIKLSFAKDDPEIHLTCYTQPLLLCHSWACFCVLKEHQPDLEFSAFAGHSLGEYTALVAAQCLDFEEAIRLVYRRGKLMGSMGKGQMLAMTSHPNLASLCEKHYCEIATINSKQQTVCAGLLEDLKALEQELSHIGINARSTFLKTEGAFHTHYMTQAALEFRLDLKQACLRTPKTQVYSNYTGNPHPSDAAAIKRNLYYQLFHTVNWLENIQNALGEGSARAIEFGGGVGKDEAVISKRPNLKSLILKIARDRQVEVDYLPAIHTQAIQQTAQALRI